MIKVSVVTDTDVLDAIRETAKAAPAKMRRKLGQIARGPRAQRLIARLSVEPGDPVRRGRGVHGQPVLRWKSAKQRRKVMAMLRAAGNIPYVRTHELSRGWTVTLDSIQEGEGLIRIYNTAPEAQFVEGDYAQPYHIDSGWPQAAPIIQEFAPGFTDDVINAWYEVTSL